MITEHSIHVVKAQYAIPSAPQSSLEEGCASIDKIVDSFKHVKVRRGPVSCMRCFALHSAQPSLHSFALAHNRLSILFVVAS